MFEGIFAPTHLIILLAIVLIVFGPQKLPELGKGMAEAMRGFKKALHEEPDAAAAPKQLPEDKGQSL